jgi:UDP-N-acetylmuramoyl-tripeptide--D-alanyl-D-alanine ligase
MVAQAKGELYGGLLADGTAVINADDDFAAYWSDSVKGRRVLRFGLNKPADVTATNVSNRGVGNGMHFTLRLSSARINIELPFDGLHNVSNALAAAAVAFALGIAPTMIKSGLENTSKVRGRLCVIGGRGGCRIIDDTYNANPASLAAAIDVLASVSGNKWLVLGDMGELGPDAAELHRTGGAIARESGIERLYAFGELAANAARTFGDGAQCYGDMDELISALEVALTPRVTLLVKGSRMMRMERIVDALAGVKQVC